MYLAKERNPSFLHVWVGGDHLANLCRFFVQPIRHTPGKATQSCKRDRRTRHRPQRNARGRFCIDLSASTKESWEAHARTLRYIRNARQFRSFFCSFQAPRVTSQFFFLEGWSRHSAGSHATAALLQPPQRRLMRRSHPREQGHGIRIGQALCRTTSVQNGMQSVRQILPH